MPRGCCTIDEELPVQQAALLSCVKHRLEQLCQVVALQRDVRAPPASRSRRLGRLAALFGKRRDNALAGSEPRERGVA